MSWSVRKMCLLTPGPAAAAMARRTEVQAAAAPEAAGKEKEVKGMGRRDIRGGGGLVR